MPDAKRAHRGMSKDPQRAPAIAIIAVRGHDVRATKKRTGCAGSDRRSPSRAARRPRRNRKSTDPGGRLPECRRRPRRASSKAAARRRPRNRLPELQSRCRSRASCRARDGSAPWVLLRRVPAKRPCLGGTLRDGSNCGRHWRRRRQPLGQRPHKNSAGDTRPRRDAGRRPAGERETSVAIKQT